MSEVAQAHPQAQRIEVWFHDEARVGQKGTLTRVWGERASRPRAVRDQRYGSLYIFGAICPERDVGAGLVMPCVSTEAMNLQLEEISCQVEASAHAVLLIDQAGWHTTRDLTVPGNITLLPLPPRSPELDPVENVWAFLRKTLLANRAFAAVEARMDACCQAWNALVNEPGRIRSIGSRNWAHPPQKL